MKSTLIILATFLIATVLLTGCKEESTAGNLGQSVFSIVSGGSGSGSSGSSGGIGTTVHLPEPATMALLGSGLFGYALFRRFKRR